MLEVKGSRHEERKDLLLQCIVRDIKKYFYFYVVAILLVVVAMQIIGQVQATRANVTQTSKELARQDKLNNDYQHLRLEQEALSELTRVSSIAKSTLNMRSPKVEEETYLDLETKGDQRGQP